MLLKTWNVSCVSKYNDEVKVSVVVNALKQKDAVKAGMIVNGDAIFESCVPMPDMDTSRYVSMFDDMPKLEFYKLQQEAKARGLAQVYDYMTIAKNKTWKMDRYDGNQSIHSEEVLGSHIHSQVLVEAAYMAGMPIVNHDLRFNN